MPAATSMYAHAAAHINGVFLPFIISSPIVSSLPIQSQSERILQPELQLAHGNARSQSTDAAEALMGSIRRRTGNGRPRQDVAVGTAKVWVVEKIEGLRPELNLVSFFDAEVLVDFRVDSENSRSDRRVASDIAELSQGCFDEGRGVVPSAGGRVREAGADPG